MILTKIDLKTVDFSTLTEEEIYWAVVEAYFKLFKQKGITSPAQPSQVCSVILKTRVLLHNSIEKLATFDLRKRDFVYPDFSKIKW
jgi:hypothetical protein